MVRSFGTRTGSTGASLRCDELVPTYQPCQLLGEWPLRQVANKERARLKAAAPEALASRAQNIRPTRTFSPPISGFIRISFRSTGKVLIQVETLVQCDCDISSVLMSGLRYVWRRRRNWPQSVNRTARTTMFLYFFCSSAIYCTSNYCSKTLLHPKALF